MFHDRWSKKVMLPRDDQWGRGASSVAQCMVWDYGYPKKPAPATQPARNDIRSRQGQRYKTRTSVKFEPKLEDTATSRISGELHAERVGAARAPTPVTSNTQHAVPLQRPSTPLQAWGASPTPRGEVPFGKGSINEDGLVAAMKDYARHTPGGTVLSDFYAAPRPPTGGGKRTESRTGGQGDSFSTARFVRVKSSGATRPSSAPTIRRPLPPRGTMTRNDYAMQRVQPQQFRPPFRPAGGAHFDKWRPLTPPSTPEVRNWWRMSKFTKNANPKISTFWENGASGPIKVRQSGPRQVNFTMDCPEQSDMIVSIRLRTASSQN